MTADKGCLRDSVSMTGASTRDFHGLTIEDCIADHHEFSHRWNLRKEQRRYRDAIKCRKGAANNET